MFRIKRLRIVLDPGGAVFAVIGVDIRGPRTQGRTLFLRGGVTRQLWAKGTWVRTRDLYGKPRKGEEMSEADAFWIEDHPASRRPGNRLPVGRG